ncbi:MAG TPA: hypothetical protein VGE06_06505 [Flavisolibacter sp.]
MGMVMVHRLVFLEFSNQGITVAGKAIRSMQEMLCLIVFDFLLLYQQKARKQGVCGLLTSFDLAFGGD